MTYDEQLYAKQLVVQDQLRRIAGLNDVVVLPVVPSPQPWEYAREAVFSPTAEGRLGYWSARQQAIIPIETCPITHPDIMAFFNAIDLDLPELRRLTVRLDSEEAPLVALEVEEVEAPELEVDLPVSVAIVLPDGTAASLIGELFSYYEIKDRVFRVSPGCFFHPNLAMAEKLVDTVVEFAALDGGQQLLELYSGVGLLTAFLAEQAPWLTAVEMNSDAAADLAVNLDHLDNVSLYHARIEEALPSIDGSPEVLVVNPGESGLARAVMEGIISLAPWRLVYVSSDLATMARDSKALALAGLNLLKVQPLDMRPQTYHIDTVSLWVK
jgi:23S rRNA (uracil1939-C5)-methyltransferase